MATGFSVFVSIGGKVDRSLAAAVSATKSQIAGLATSLTGIGARLEAPFQAVQRHIDATSKRFERMQRRGRDASLAITAPAALGAKNGYDTVLGFEKELNKVQAYGEISDKERQRIEENARAMARIGLAGAREAVELQRRYIQAGRTVDQAIGMTRPTLNFSLYGDVDPAKAADVITSVAAAYQKPMETLEQAQQVATRIGDVLAKGANISRADVRDFADGFKYAAPFAARAGMSIEQLAAAIATMNQNGIAGNEAGVAIRSMLVRMVKPTAGARSAIASYGLAFEDFVEKWKTFSTKDFAGALATRGIKVPESLAASVQQAVAGMSLEKDSGAVREKVTKMLVDGMKLKPRDGKIVANAVSSYIMGLADQVNADGLIRALEEKGVSLGAIANLFDVRQGARLSTLFGDKTYQSFLQEILNPKTNGASSRGADTMLKGLYGAHLRFQFAWDNLWISIARSGVLQHVTDLLVTMANTLDRLGGSNPESLKMGVYLAAAAAAAGPLLFALGTLGRLATFAFTGLNQGLMLLLAPIGLVARGIAGLGGLLAAGIGAIAAVIRPMIMGLLMLANVGGAGAVFSAIGASMLAFGRAVLLFPLVALRAISMALLGLVMNPVGLAITAVVAGLTALGLWVYNNWEGVKSFFAGFGEGFMKGLGPAGESLGKITGYLNDAWTRLNNLLGPISASNDQWQQWGATLGGAVASGVNAVIDGISRLIGFFDIVIGKAISFGGYLRSLWPFGGGGAGAVPASPAPIPPVSGARALGGPVSFGKPYLVGERGPELFVPWSGGRIETNDTLRRLTADGTAASAAATSYTTSRSNQATITLQIDGGGDPQAIARAAEEAVYRAFARLESEQRGLLSD